MFGLTVDQYNSNFNNAFIFILKIKPQPEAYNVHDWKFITNLILRNCVKEELFKWRHH